MPSWSVVQTLGDFIEPSGIPARPTSKWGALCRVISAAGRAIVPCRKIVALFLPNLDLNGEILLKSNLSGFELSIRSLVSRRPPLVLVGSLDRLCRYFGVDNQHSLSARITANDLVVLFGRKGPISVAVHAALHPDQTGFVQKLCVGTSIGVEALPEYAPAIIDRTANRITVQRIEGQSFMPWRKPEKALQAAILAALEPVSALYARRNPLQTPDEEYVRLLRRFVLGHPHRNELSAGLQVLDEWNRSALRSVTVHGDYWLNNLLSVQDRITGVVDWDRARRNGSPGFDALHLGFMSYAMWADKYVSELLVSLWTNEWPYPWLAQYTKLIANMFMLSRSDIQALGVMLWLSYFYHHAIVEPRTEWFHRMIEPVRHALSAAPLVDSQLHVA